MPIQLVYLLLALNAASADIEKTNDQTALYPNIPVAVIEAVQSVSPQNGTRIPLASPAPVPAQSEPTPALSGDWPPADYNRMRRPLAKGPVNVKTGIEVSHFLGVNDAEQVATLDFVLHLSWIDRRLKWDLKKSGIMQRRIDPEQLWIPGMDILNQREPFKVLKQVAIVHGADGMVTIKRRILAKLVTSMDFGNFPFDSHKVTIDMESFFYNAEEVIFSKDDSNTKMDPAMDDPTWSISKFELTVDNPITNTEDLNSQLSGIVHISRKRTGAVNNLVLPLALIVFMSLSQFYMHLDRFDVRVGVVSTAILTIMAFQYSIMSQLPKIAYLTWIQYYSLICSVYVFMSLVEVVVVHYMDHTQTYPKVILAVEAQCRFWYPVTFICCTIIMVTLGAVLA